MLKEERNIANIFFPSCPKDEQIKEGILVGFNYEGFLFVIVAVIPLDSIPKSEYPGKTKVEVLDEMIRERR